MFVDRGVEASVLTYSPAAMALSKHPIGKRVFLPFPQHLKIFTLYMIKAGYVGEVLCLVPYSQAASLQHSYTTEGNSI